MLLGGSTTAAKAHSAYTQRLPYPHLVADDAFDADLLTAVREELEQLAFTPKETDLYRLAQSPDLSNLGAESGLASLARLRDTIYSSSFRQQVEEVTGCGTLSAQVDLAGAVYSSGSHLLVHDDVIGTRRVSFIVYLTDPASNWSAEDGGALELYPSGKTSEGHAFPASAPTARVLPIFNRMALFTVKAGVSFHAVQEVLTAKDRISLQGWFHAAESNDTSGGAASIKELRAQTNPPVFAPFATPQPKIVKRKYGKVTALAPQLSSASKETLASLGVHPMYLEEQNIAVLADTFKRQGVVRLASFLVPPLVQPLESLIRTVDQADELGLGNSGVPDANAGAVSGWRIAGPSHVRRCLECVGDDDAGESEEAGGSEGIAAFAKRHRPESSSSSFGLKKSPSATVQHPHHSDLGEMLLQVQANLLESQAFAELVACIKALGHPKAITARHTAVRRFRPGLDYSLATIPSETPEIDARLTFCVGPDGDSEGSSDDDGVGEEVEVGAGDEEKKQQDEESAEEEDGDEGPLEDLWESCEVGGFDSYLKAADESAGGAVVADDEDAVTNLPCQSNVLTIALRRPDQMHFVKYLQAVAPSSRYDVSAVLRE